MNPTLIPFILFRLPLGFILGLALIGAIIERITGERML